MSEVFLTRKAHMVQCLISSCGTDKILIVKDLQGTSSNCLVFELMRAILMVFAELTGGSWRLRRPVATLTEVNNVFLSLDRSYGPMQAFWLMPNADKQQSSPISNLIHLSSGLGVVKSAMLSRSLDILNCAS